MLIVGVSLPNKLSADLTLPYEGLDCESQTDSEGAAEALEEKAEGNVEDSACGEEGECHSTVQVGKRG